MQEHRASAFSVPELTHLWNRGYAGYFVPVNFTEAQLEVHFRCGGIDLDRSLVWTEGDDPAAFSYLGVRGERGWIGGFGIAPEYRGQGLSYDHFARHVETARAGGLRHVQLEVFTTNWARRVYERAGFAVTRRVAVLHGRLPEGGAGEDVRSADPLALLAHHERLHAASEPTWNREQAWVRASVEWGGVEAMQVGPADKPSAVAWLRTDGDVVRIVDAAAASDEAARHLAAGIATRYAGRAAMLVNEPEETSIARAFGSLGLEVGRQQYEMHLQA